MAYGVYLKWRSFPLIPITFLLAWLMLDSVRAQEQKPDAAEPAQAETPLTGFDLIDAYSAKVKTLKEFQVAHRLQETELRNKENRAADKLNRLIGGLEILMQQEAEKLYEEAITAKDPEVRDRLLIQLKNLKSLQLQEVRIRAENALKRRTVGETVYPTIKEAEEKRRQLDEEESKKAAEIEKQDLEDVEKLAQDLPKDVLEAARVFAEQDAQKKLEDAVRLVLPQRMVQLQDIAGRFPDTKAGAEASAMLAAIQEQNEVNAGQKLHQALQAPVIYGQRWRRLKEIQRDYPATRAAAEAQKLFAEHLTQVPPAEIANHTDGRVKLTVDRPYGRLEEVTLSPGESRGIPSAFPLMVRVNVGDDEWNVYRAWPGLPYVVQTTQGVPVFYYLPCAPEMVDAPKPTPIPAPNK